MFLLLSFSCWVDQSHVASVATPVPFSLVTCTFIFTIIVVAFSVQMHWEGYSLSPPGNLAYSTFVHALLYLPAQLQVSLIVTTVLAFTYPQDGAPLMALGFALQNLLLVVLHLPSCYENATERSAHEYHATGEWRLGSIQVTHYLPFADAVEEGELETLLPSRVPYDPPPFDAVVNTE